ncbi:MAG: hypothetical protein IPL72_01550 [Sulfuritalea sp.]|nr:hypothetical protein [Sulfuritalea sp.]
MTELRTTVNSFDLFDTLLARKCVDSQGIFTIVERAFGASGFAAARRAAEFRLAEIRPAFDIHDIYGVLVDTGTVTRADADRLLAAEIDAEFDNAVPVAENLRRVREGDLVVSDMYLPPEVLRRLLQHVGLRSHVNLYVSNLGKHFGRIWPELASRWIIATHVGDNLHSDVETPRRHGIPTIHYTGTQPSRAESMVAGNGFPALARIMRSLRLRNPHDTGSPAHELWRHGSQFNLPLLVFLAQMLRARRDAAGVKKILFSARDCYLAAEIFSTLFPGEPSEYIHVSREVLFSGGTAERDYLLQRGLRDSVVCDIAATGSSWHGFAHRHGIRVRLFTLIFIDNWPLARVAPQEVVASDKLDFSYALRSSALNPYSPAIEVLNPAPHGTALGVDPTGSFFSPRLARTSEFDPQLVAVLVQCHNAAIAMLRKDRAELVAEMAAPPVATMASLVEAISSSPLLNSLGKQLQWPPSFGPMMN